MIYDSIYTKCKPYYSDKTQTSGSLESKADETVDYKRKDES